MGKIKQSSRREKITPATPTHRRLREGLFILLIALGLFIFLAFITYHRNDPAWSNTGISDHARNLGGRFGAFIADVFLYLFGYIAYILPLAIAYSGWLVLREPAATATLTTRQMAWIRSLGFLLALTSGCGLFDLYLSASQNYLPYSAGGILGHFVGIGLSNLLNIAGATLLMIAGFLCGITLFTGVSWIKVAHILSQFLLHISRFLQQQAHTRWQAWQVKRQQAKQVEPEIIVKSKKPLPLQTNESSVAVKIVKPVKQLTAKNIKPVTKEINKTERSDTKFADIELDSLPPLSLLEEAQQSTNQGYSEAVLERLSRLVEDKLQEFGIQVKVVAVYPGPVITRFELELAPGIKVSKLSGLAKDIARSLSLSSVRIVEVIPGKSYVGLEIPNQHREIVRLSEILSSTEYAQASSALSLGLGKDIAGIPVVVDLKKMPHLLVAGTTGSGKSVGLNAMLLSLLYKSTPDMVRLILVDPKMLELSIYDGIPHLLTPVITDMKRAANALRWCIGEMERRYRLMSALGVRNLKGYNEKVRQAKKSGEPLADPLWEPVEGESAPELEVLPFIVLLIDEFADMMMVVGKKVDELIARLAQKARAAGIHLILATQRPSVDVITGLIKANIPTRIAYQVSSRVDSRTILDQQGAEQLLGQGDMLYLEAGMGQPVRVHGALVADNEVHKVVKDLKAKGKPVYLEAVTEGNSDVGTPRADVPGLNLGNKDEGVDELFDHAVAIVAKTRRASISNVQRRLKIGYNRAARILEQMEEQGMVTPMETNGTREVLLPPTDDEN